MRFGLNIPAGAVQSGTFAGTYLLTGTLQTGIVNPRITITGAGINAYNAIGTNTFILSSADGSITINGGTITGGTIRTAASGARVEMTGAQSTRISLYTGDIREFSPAYVTAYIRTGPLPANDQPVLTMIAPDITGLGGAAIEILSNSTAGAPYTAVINMLQTTNFYNPIVLKNTPSGYTLTTSNSGAISTVSTTLATLTIVTGVSAGGLYRVEFTCLGLTGTVLADVFQFTLRLAGAGFAAQYAKISSITSGSTGITFFGYINLPAFTTNTLTVTCIRAVGSGTVVVQAGVGLPYVLAANAVIG